MSFGMESGRLNKKSASWSYELAGGNGKFTVGSPRNAGIFGAKGSIGHFEGGYSYDASKILPGFKLKAGADLADFTGDAKARIAGIEYKVASAGINTLGANASLGIGGDTIFPYAKAGVYTASPEIEVGKIGIGLGEGINASGKADLLSFAGEKTIGATSKLDYSPFGVKADAKSSFGEFSAKLPGIGSIKGDEKGRPVLKTDISTKGLEKYQGYAEFFKGQGGKESASVKELFSSGFNRGSLLHEAESQHKKNSKVFKRFEGRNSRFAVRNFDRTADMSRGLVDRLNEAIGISEIQRQEIGQMLADPNLNAKDAEKLSSQSKRLSEDITRMKDSRDKLASDVDQANRNLNRYNGDGIAFKSTDQIVSDAKANAQALEDTYAKYGWGKELAEPAISVCASRNELNSRINLLNRQINEKEAMIDLIDRQRENYLKEKGTTFSDAVGSGDKRILELNGYEKELREENKELRSEKGECQKALLETDRKFGAGESEEIRSKGRELEKAKIDNENDIAAADDKIADYANSKGIPKDQDGNYLSDNDQGLKELKDEKASLEQEKNEKQREIDINKKEIADSENKNNTGFTVNENEGNAQLDFAEDKYSAHVQDNKDIRKGKEAEAESSKGERKEDPVEINPAVSKNEELPVKDETTPERESSTPVVRENEKADQANGEPVKQENNQSKEETAPSRGEEQNKSSGMPVKAVDTTDPGSERQEKNTPEMPAKNVSESAGEPKTVSQGMPSTNVNDTSKEVRSPSSGMPTMAYGQSESAPVTSSDVSKSIGPGL